MKALRILVADDHDVVRQGLRSLLESQPGWQVVAEARTGREAIERATELQPDLVVMDIGMPQLNGLEATRQIRKSVPAAAVLVLTMHESEQIAREVLAAGARGYVLKSDASRDLVEAVEALSQQRWYFTTRVSEMVLKGYLESLAAPAMAVSADSPSGILSAREREIVQLLAEGKSSKQVALALSLSVKTVETHRANIMRKLDLHSISDLVRYAVRNKIVEP